MLLFGISLISHQPLEKIMGPLNPQTASLSNLSFLSAFVDLSSEVKGSTLRH